MNNFKTFLGQLVDSDHNVYGAVIMGFEGTTLSKYFSNDLPMTEDVYEAFVAEFAPLVQSFYSKSSDMSLGETRSITASMDHVLVLFKVLSKNYFLGVIAKPSAFLGKIDYYATREVSRVQNLFNV